MDQPIEWTVYDPTSLGEAIRWFREEQDVTQAEVADATGVHRPYISRIERGHATQQSERLFRVLRRLGLEIVVRRRSP